MTRILILTFIVFYSFSAATPVFAEIIDRSVAIVNNDVITLSEVKELGAPLFKSIAERTPPEQLQETLQRARMAVIEKIISKKLLLGEAERYNVTVSEEELDNAIANVIARNQTSMQELIKEINQMGLSKKEYREDLRDQILKAKLVNIAVHSKIVIPEEKIIEFYNNHYTQGMHDDGYHILHIGVSHGQDSGGTENSRADALEKIEKIRQQALAGTDFRSLAREHSDLPSAAYGGDIGIFQKEDMRPTMQKVITILEPGGLSTVVETREGFQIFKLISHQDGHSFTKIPFETVKEDIREILYQQKIERLYEEWMKDIRQQAYIRIL